MLHVAAITTSTPNAKPAFGAAVQNASVGLVGAAALRPQTMGTKLAKGCLGSWSSFASSTNGAVGYPERRDCGAQEIRPRNSEGGAGQGGTIE